MDDLKFRNYTLSNEEVESIIKQYEKYINSQCFVDGIFNEDLKQEICINIFVALTKNRKNL